MDIQINIHTYPIASQSLYQAKKKFRSRLQFSQWQKKKKKKKKKEKTTRNSVKYIYLFIHAFLWKECNNICNTNLYSNSIFHACVL